MAFSAVLPSSFLDVGNLILEAFKGIAVHEVVVAGCSRIVLRIVAITPLEDFGIRSTRQVEWLRLEWIVVELVEVSIVGELVIRPDTFQAFDEFTAPAVAFSVVEPPLANAGELFTHKVSQRLVILRFECGT